MYLFVVLLITFATTLHFSSILWFSPTSSLHFVHFLTRVFFLTLSLWSFIALSSFRFSYVKIRIKSWGLNIRKIYGKETQRQNMRREKKTSSITMNKIGNCFFDLCETCDDISCQWWGHCQRWVSLALWDSEQTVTVVASVNGLVKKMVRTYSLCVCGFC